MRCHHDTPRKFARTVGLSKRAVKLTKNAATLQMEPRHVAPAGTKSENPGAELEPDQMETLITQDRAKFVKLARALRDTAVA